MDLHNHFNLIRRFLNGSKALFLLSMLASALSALCDMVSPQIVRIALDYALGGADDSVLPFWIRMIVLKLGGFRVLGEKIWIFALAVVLVALI